MSIDRCPDGGTTGQLCGIVFPFRSSVCEHGLADPCRYRMTREVMPCRRRWVGEYSPREPWVPPIATTRHFPQSPQCLQSIAILEVRISTGGLHVARILLVARMLRQRRT